MEIDSLHTFSEATFLDRESQNRGLPEKQLMGQAALSSAIRIEKDLLPLPGGRLILLAGGGNNGGDGFALIHMLLGAGLSPDRFVVFAAPESRSEAARFYREIVVGAGIPIHPFSELQEFSVSREDLILEALLGTGQKGAPAGKIRPVLDWILSVRSLPRFPALLALDLPAGLSEDTHVEFLPPGPDPAPGPPRKGAQIPRLPLPDEIHQYGTRKLAVSLQPSLVARSRVLTFPVGFHPAVQKKIPVFARSIEDSFHPDLFRKSPEMHKYLCGAGCIIGGSPGMIGAAFLSASSFFAAGGGILQIRTPDPEDGERLLKLNPSLMVQKLDPARIPEAPAILIGPGLELNTELEEGLILGLNRIVEKNLYPEESGDKTRPVENSLPWILLDAGACRLVVHPGYPESLLRKTLLTPHTGEWKAMGGGHVRTVKELIHEKERLEKSSGYHVILKDAVTVVFAKESANEIHCEIFSRPGGNLAVAGSGDVLAGILLATLSRHRPRPGDLPELIRQVLILHSLSGQKSLHPSADTFPDRIRSALQSDRKGSGKF